MYLFFQVLSAVFQNILELHHRSRHTRRPELCVVACPRRPATSLGPRSSIWYFLLTRITVSLAISLANISVRASCSFRRHLLGNGKREEAVRVVAELNDAAVDDPVVIDAIEELEFAIKAENEGGKATWMECFSTRNALWKRTGNGMMLQFIQQLNGQNFYCKF